MVKLYIHSLYLHTQFQKKIKTSKLYNIERASYSQTKKITALLFRNDAKPKATAPATNNTIEEETLDDNPNTETVQQNLDAMHLDA